MNDELDVPDAPKTAETSPSFKQFFGGLGVVIVIGARLCLSWTDPKKQPIVPPPQATVTSPNPALGPGTAPFPASIPIDTAGQTAAPTLDPNYAYCLALLKKEKEHSLAGVQNLNDAAARCEAMFFDLQHISGRGVDRRFTDWTSRYSDLLLELKTGFKHLAARSSTEYNQEMMLRTLISASQGDAFAPAVEEGRRISREDSLIENLLNHRLRLLGELVRLFNEVAPPEGKVSLVK